MITHVVAGERTNITNSQNWILLQLDQGEQKEEKKQQLRQPVFLLNNIIHLFAKLLRSIR